LQFYLRYADYEKDHEFHDKEWMAMFKVTDLKPRIGSRIETDLESLVSGRYASEILSLIEARGVLLFRGLDICDEDQLAIASSLGPTGDEDVGVIYKVSQDKEQNPTHYLYNRGNFSWHIDRTDTDVPPHITMLCAKKLSPADGETEFANTYAAYQDLPDDDKQLIDGLKVLHRVSASFRETVPDPTDEMLELWAMRPDKVHPLVWRHRNGRKSLITSTSGLEVLGMDKDEGEALLARMMAWATQPKYVYVHDWQLGDLVMWDNTGTMHRARQYDLDCGRLLHRAVVLGDEPFDTQQPSMAA
jgi:alpha-ketoglutarate-dependent taurine dioxygenase